jgi:hypothetical protein
MENNYTIVPLTEEERITFNKEFNELLNKNSFTASMLPQYTLIEGTSDFKTTVSLIIQKKVIEPEVIKDETITEA